MNRLRKKLKIIFDKQGFCGDPYCRCDNCPEGCSCSNDA